GKPQAPAGTTLPVTPKFKDRTIRFNGAAYYEDWKDFQFSFLGPNSFTEIRNAGQARIKGLESELSWATPVDGLHLSAAASITDAKLASDYCGTVDSKGVPIKVCGKPQAPAGTTLPVTPKFKGNAVARYEFPVGDMNAHVQGAVVFQTSSWADLRLTERALLGRQSGFQSVDLSAGLDRDTWNLEVALTNLGDIAGETIRTSECTPTVCGQTYVRPIRPRTISIKFGQKF
ncbi:MAG: TonB-dependent receptor, partial [Alphaproteobacteria bacterium]